MFSEEEKKCIVYRYQNENIGVNGLAGEYKVGKLKIKNILNEFGIESKKRGGQSINNSSIEEFKLIKYESNVNLVAKCKLTNIIFNDPNNLSGVLTTHIIKTYGNISIPNNNYQRKKYEKEHGKKWFEEYFDIIEIDLTETKKCFYCEWVTTDIKNLSGQYQVHLENEHNICIQEHLINNPIDKEYFKVHSNIIGREVKLTNINNYVTCKICGERMKVINNTHLNKHNITNTEYKLRYPDSKMVSNNTLKTFSDNLKSLNLDIKPKWTSKAEIAIVDFISELGINTEKSRNRGLLNGKELDIVIPSKNICIEYNGLYYHREKMGKHINYHLDKTIACNNIGYNLIHIFEDEWVNNTELVKYKLKHLLGVSSGFKIGARKCVIREIDSHIKNEFLDKYHIQGKDRSNIKLGAFYNDILVGVMTFSSNMNMVSSGSDGEYTLSRFTTNYEFIISGLPSKILKYFIREYQPKSIISFADRRWTLKSNDNMYTKLGFDLVKITKPDYKYYNSSIDKYKRFHKFGFGKKSLKIKYPDIYSDNKSEWVIMQELGYDRIWDCGLFKYELKL